MWKVAVGEELQASREASKSIRESIEYARFIGSCLCECELKKKPDVCSAAACAFLYVVCTSYAYFSYCSYLLFLFPCLCLPVAVWPCPVSGLEDLTCTCAQSSSLFFFTVVYWGRYVGSLQPSLNRMDVQRSVGC